MPLRARLASNALSGPCPLLPGEMMDFGPQPGDEVGDVLFSVRSRVGTVQLNNPKKLNSLTASMIRKMIPMLREWEKSDDIDFVVVTASGPKAFCAGGDVATLARQNRLGPHGQRESIKYFAIEYMLNHLIATYEKPYIAIIDGITMGGGMGLSCHAPFRIATEKTVFAMPETDIGLFPDVGGGFFLSRLDGGLGPYLALTSDRLVGVQTYYAGIATHYMHSSAIPGLLEHLTCGKIQFSKEMSHLQRLKLIDTSLGQLSSSVLSHADPILLAGEKRAAIDEVFELSASVPDILQRLSSIGDGQTRFGSPQVIAWAKKTHHLIMTGRSPTSMAVTMQQLKLAQRWTIEETFRREHIIAARFMQHPDFASGVKSKLIDKPPTIPRWDPPSPSEVSGGLVNEFFSAPEGLPSLEFFDQGSRPDYSEYPHVWISLPSENQIKAFLTPVANDVSKEEIIQRVMDGLAGITGKSAGLERKVEEVWDRMRMSTA